MLHTTNCKYPQDRNPQDVAINNYCWSDAILVDEKMSHSIGISDIATEMAPLRSVCRALSNRHSFSMVTPVFDKVYLLEYVIEKNTLELACRAAQEHCIVLNKRSCLNRRAPALPDGIFSPQIGENW